jgi:cobalt-zinc-cadmium efflux system membrane fusion protein
MNAKNIGLLILGAVLGLLAGAGGLYFAQSKDLLPSQLDTQSNVVGEHAHESHETPEGNAEPEGDEHAHADAGHAGHEHEEEHGPIALTPEIITEAGIEIAEAAGGRLRQTIALPGEVVLNPDKLAHIVPRVGGIVGDVKKTVGDQVETGDLLAVLESRELAEARAAYLAGQQRLALAQANLAANEELKAKGIVPDLEFLAAKRDLAEAEIELRAAEFKLHTLGVPQAELAAVEQQSDEKFPFHELRAPFAGTVIARHITSGEVVTTETDVFQLADLGDVWVNLTVYQKDLENVKAGQRVSVITGHDIARTSGTISYVSPVVDEATRTAVARVVLPNPDGRWRPGLFVTGRVETDFVDVAVLVPRSALQSVEGNDSVFVETPEGFARRPVTVGRANETQVEITAGLRPGERYVAAGAFSLKAQLGKASFGSGHAH